MSVRPEAVQFPKRAILLEAVKAKLAEFAGTAVTLRQLYYRLVAAGAIPNNIHAYKNLGAALTKWRREGTIPISAFEDRTRGMAFYDVGQMEDNPEGWLKYFVNDGIKKAKNYNLARWRGQDYRVVVAVEKQALEGPFSEVCDELAVDLAVCRGYPSISFLAEVAQALRDRNDGRENVILYFGDFDPSGLDIPRAVETDLSGLFGQNFEFKRVALTQEQAEEMNLIPAPAKQTDIRYEGFAAEHGEEVFELDAIEPSELQNIIRDAVDEYFDEDVFTETEALIERGTKKIQGLLTKSGVEKFLSDLKGSVDSSEAEA